VPRGTPPGTAGPPKQRFGSSKPT